VAVEVGPSVGLLVVHMRYRVGSRDESPSERGYAHLIEHLLFRSRSRHVNVYHDEIWATGGVANASTWLDFSKYYTSIPPDALELVFRLEAERMTCLVTDIDVIRSECRLIAAEYAGLAAADPCGIWDEDLQKLAFPIGHRYHHSAFGPPHRLMACTPDSLIAFHRRYYAPNNAVLAIAGGLDLSRAELLAQRYFGRLPARAVPRRCLLASARGGLQMHRNIAATQSRIFVAYPAPAFGTHSHRHLSLLGDVLVSGRSCRFALAQTTGAPFAEYGFELLSWLDAAFVVVWAVILPNVASAEAVHQLRDLVETFGSLTDDEIARANALDRIRIARLNESSAERADEAAFRLEQNRALQFAEDSLRSERRDLMAAALVFNSTQRIQLEYKGTTT